ncbi:MAG: 23S rRNA (uracil(1939)-C(5))-methyltransferase RlmD [Deltaproteobacteria bacterium]|nr:23S rRNA (uracil(1939)-C(5))-methyltransferase RlmD [Deltaproteobacteria bacterium]
MTTDTAPYSRPGPATGSVHVLSVHDLAVSGGGVARLDGMTVFLDRGLPGETLRCRITERKPRFARAEVLETVTPSPDTAPSFCAFSDACGGCAWTTLSYPAQLAWKERQVKETLRRIGKVDFDRAGYLPIIPSPRPTRYRNKMEFAFGFEGDAPALGLRQRNSRAVVPVADCSLCALPVTDILAVTRQWMREKNLAPYDGKNGFLRFLVVRCPDYTPDGAPRCLVECITTPGGHTRDTEALGKLLMEKTPATGFLHSIRAAGADVAYGEKTVVSLGETTVRERFGDVVLEAPVRAFLQANTAAAALLYEQVREYAEKENTGTVWDMYCGVGGIALFLAKEGRVVRGIETVDEAVRFARKNAAASPGDHAFIRDDAGLAATKLFPRPDLVVTDPPRAGMSPGLRRAILELHPSRVIAISCDAASLARDVAALGSAYRVESARAVDLFPHTPHIETVALLSLSSG